MTKTGLAKKIAIVVCAFPPQGGGMGNNAYYQAKKLSEFGYAVTVFTPRFKDIKKIEPAPFNLEYLKVYWAWGKAGWLLPLGRRLKDFDLIHLYYPFFGTDLIIWFFKIFQPRKKLILHYQMDPVGRGWKKWFFKIYFKLFFGFLVRASDRIIILSADHGRHSYLKKYLESKPEKFVVMPNGVDTAIFRPRPKDADLARKYQLAPADQVAIFVGGLDRQHYFKGVEVLLRAWQKIAAGRKNYKLMIVGDGDLKASYQKLARTLGVAEQVIFTGWIKNEDLPAYYGLADVFVLPSTARTESFGIVIAEAQACGLPAVVANWPGSRQTLIDGETGFLAAPNQVDDLSEKISRLLSDENLRKQMGERAHVRAAALYDWSKIIFQLEKNYQEVLLSE